MNRSSLILRSLPVVLYTTLPMLSHGVEEKNVTSKVTGVTVYLQRAQVERSASTDLPAGETRLVFSGLSQELDAMSIEVSGKGAFTILNVENRINYLSPVGQDEKVKDLQKRIKALEHDYYAEENTKVVWDNEEQLLLKNWAVGGQQNGVSATQLQGVNEYTRTRLAIVKAGQLAQTEKLATINEELNNLRAQLSQVQGEAQRPTGEIVVSVIADAATTATFTLKYAVNSAGWQPAYDLRVDAVGSPIKLKQKALVMQNCGEVWERVRLTLSSGNPAQGQIMPQIQPWYVYMNSGTYLESVAIRSREGKVAGYDVPMAAPAMREMDGEDMKTKEPDATFAWASNVVQRTTQVEYEIDLPQSVPSDGQYHNIMLQDHSLGATYKHYVTPKLDKDAFLFARVTGWEELDLLPGNANVFFDGSFVGQTYLDLAQVRDTVNISLGRDPNVVVKREKRKDFCKKQTIGGKRTDQLSWEISVRNAKSSTVEIEVLDQYPVSQQSEVEVELTESSGATVDKDKGMLTWKLALGAKETKKLIFSYTVKYPKDNMVILE